MKNIFISYSHEPNKDKLHVRKFADKLIELGLPIIIDRYDLRFGHDIDQFMQDISNPEKYIYILVMCTTEYKLRADSGKGNVGKEAVYIKTLINNNPFQERIIPIIIDASENPKSLLPNFFPTNTYYADISKEPLFDGSETKNLVEHIRGIRPFRPLQSHLETLVSYALSELPGMPRDVIGIYKQETDKKIYEFCRESYDNMLRIGYWLDLRDETRAIEQIYSDLQYFSDYIPDYNLVISTYILLWELKDKDISHNAISPLAIIENAIELLNRNNSDPLFPFRKLILEYRKAISLHRKDRFDEALVIYDELMLDDSQEILDSEPIVFFTAALYSAKIYKHLGSLIQANKLFKNVIRSCEAAFLEQITESIYKELLKIYYCALWSLTEKNENEMSVLAELEQIKDRDFLTYMTFCKSHYPTLFGLPLLLIPTNNNM